MDAKLSPGDEMGQCLKDWFDRLNTAYDAGEIRVSYDKWKRLTLAADRLFHEGLAAATDAEVALFRDVDERVRYAGSNRRNPGRP